MVKKILWPIKSTERIKKKMRFMIRQRPKGTNPYYLKIEKRRESAFEPKGPPSPNAWKTTFTLYTPLSVSLELDK